MKCKFRLLSCCPLFSVILGDDQISHRTRLTRLSKEMLETKLVGIRCISRFGFRLIDNTFVFGPIAVFPMTVLSWRVPSPEHITEESVEFFTLLEPKIDVLVIGAGGRKNVDTVRKQVAPFLIRKKIGFEIMDTVSEVFAGSIMLIPLHFFAIKYTVVYLISGCSFVF